MSVFDSLQLRVQNIFKKTPCLFIDLGSSHTRVYMDNTQIFNEPTCIAVHTQTQAVVAFGTKALNLLGKTPDSVEVVFPVVYGEIAHPQYLEYYFLALFETLLPHLDFKRYLFGLSAKVAIPSSLSPAKKSLLQQTLKSVGLTQVEYVATGLALAHRLRLTDSTLKDICILDIGAQKSEIAIFSLQELIQAKSYRWGGVMVSEQLQKIVRNTHHCVISWHAAEEAKKTLGTLLPSKQKIAVTGKDLVTQASKTVIVTAQEFAPEFAVSFDELLENIEQFMALLPSEVAVSVLDKGMYVTGAGSQLGGIDQAITQKFKCSVILAKNPELDTIIGLQALQKL